MSTENLSNFDQVKKEVNLRKPHQRKKKESKKTPRELMRLIWWAIKYRCFDPKNEAYPRYGGRGITMSKPWDESFETFCNDMGPRPSMFHSVERRENSGNYCKENCYWGTPSEQTRNKRSNLLVTYKGETMIMTDLAVKYGLNYGTIYNRVAIHGWSIEDAIEKPSKHQWLIFYEGSLYSRRGLCKHLGLKFDKVHYHISKGKSVKEAFEICLRLQSMEC